MLAVKVERLLYTSQEMLHLAQLHKQGLNEPMTSNRGVHAIERIYRRLAYSGHAVYRATTDGRTLGGLVVLKSGLNRQSIFILFNDPLSWIRSINALGVRDFIRQLVDLVAVKQIARQIPSTDYGVALYVDEVQEEWESPRLS